MSQKNNTSLSQNKLYSKKVSYHISHTQNFETNEFDLLKNEIISKTDFYVLYRAVKSSDDSLYLIKEYKKSVIRAKNLKHAISRQISVHENVLGNDHLLNLVGRMEDSTSTYLVFDTFHKTVDFKDRSESFEEKKLVLYDVLNALIDINKFGYSVLSLELENIIKITNEKYGICNLDHLTKHNEELPRELVEDNSKYLPQEVKVMRTCYSKSDSWLFGILII